MDFSLTQRIVKTLQLKFSIQNLLNVPVEMAQDDNFDFKYEPEHLNKGIGSQFTDQGDNIYSRFNPDRYYVLSVTYSF
jgi:outer membrane receptor for ferrienterochelin and colicin